MSENGNSVASKLKKLLEVPRKRAAIFAHAGPDPDALGSMMAVHWLLSKFNIESDLFYSGHISHPQNIAMVNLLDPNLRTIEEYSPEHFDFHILVDTVPKNAGIGNHKIDFDVVFDHHKENCAVDYDGLFINFKAGSCCGTIYHVLKEMGFTFVDGNEADAKIVTALLIGVSTDTENLMSDDCSEYEFRAWADLFTLRNPVILRRIVNYERPKFWIDTKASAAINVVQEEGVAIVGMGFLPSKHRDVIADMSQEMATWEDVHTAIAFALIDGVRVEGSVRSSNASISVPNLCKVLGGKYGCGGGKLGKGAYRYELGGGCVEEDDSDEMKQKLWEIYREKETKRIQRQIKK